jgi:N-methylhydantoinase B
MNISGSSAPIFLEVLRSRLQSIAEDAVAAVVRTAISPSINEALDCGAVLLDASGKLLVGAGTGSNHWLAAQHAVRSTLKQYGSDIHQGDVFLANDPYNGGGLHPADIVVQRPIFVDDRHVAWAALSAHMMDMGGMSVGSWAPQATECYQEAFRLPPVRAISGGEDVAEIWNILRTNIRFSGLVEMDIRGLAAGGYVAEQRVAETAASVGAAAFINGINELMALSERGLRERIAKIAPGEYRTVGWSEWGEKFITTPCKLTVKEDTLSFDFEGSDAQIPFFINSQPYIIKTLFMPQLASTIAPDLPFNEGVLAPIEMFCPEASVVQARAPAPMNCGHMHLASSAAEAMYRCLRLALWASPEYAASATSMVCPGYVALFTSSWSGKGADGPESWIMTDGCMTGGAAFSDADGEDFTMVSLDLPEREFSTPMTLDIESYELWYPLLVKERSLKTGAYGAGRWRSGAALSLSFDAYESDGVTGQMLGQRGHLALSGESGGNPGRVPTVYRRKPDGSGERISMSAANLVIERGDSFEIHCGSSGGWGDPLDREPAKVASDAREGRFSAAEAQSVYGVCLVEGTLDVQATVAERSRLRHVRLETARPPRLVPEPRPISDDGAALDLPLYPGIVQRNRAAYAAASGTLLAVAPTHWTDGCAILETAQRASGANVLIRSFLDPKTGTALCCEAVPAGAADSFISLPDHWTAAA